MAVSSSRLAASAGSLALVACGWFAAHTLAQDLPVATQQQERIVSDIVIRNTGRVDLDEARVRSLLRTREGLPLNLQNTDEDIRNLIDSGLVAGNPSISLEELDGGNVRLIYSVEGRASVGSIAFEGNTVFNDERLREELADEDEGVGIEPGTLPSGAQLAAARTLIQELYRDRGYPDVFVEVVESEPQAGFSQVVFRIDEGIRGEVDKIEFVGNETLSDNELKKVMGTREKGIFSFLTDSGQIDNNVLADDRRRIEELYQDKGFLNARVAEVQRRPAGDDMVDLIVVIEEGSRYGIGRVGIEGTEVFLPEDLIENLQLQAGDTYSASGLREDVGTIRDYYGSRGYTNVNIIPDIVETGDNLLEITYRISEGRPATVGRVNIEGNTKTQDRVIRREIPLEPGDPFSTVELDATEQRLSNLGYFDQVDVSSSPTADPRYEDVNVLVNEKPTGSLGVSVGVSSVDSLVGTLTLGQTNFDWRNWPTFTGAGQRFNATILAGTERRDIQIGFTEPWLFGRRLAFGWDAFYRDLFFLSDAYDQNETGIRTRLRWPFGENGSLSLIYTFQQVTIDGVDNDASEFLQSQEGDYIQSSLGLEYEYDTRNKIVFPDEGRQIVLGVENTSLGSDFDATKLNASFVQYVPLRWDLVLDFSGGIEVVDGDPPVFYRTYLGGPRDLRGFDFRDVSPTDENGEPIGGQTSLYGSVELTFPIIESVRGAVFYDVGLNSPDSFDFGGDVNSDVGVGLRLDLPIGPLQLDLGFPLQTSEFNDDGAQFHFSVGYEF